MKLFFKSAPLQLPRIDIAEAWKLMNSSYAETVRMLLRSGLPGGPSISSLQRGPHVLSPLDDQITDPMKARHSFIPDIRQYLLDNGITDRTRQDAFIDANGARTPRVLIDKEAADVHEKMARATRQSGFGRNNPGFEFGDSAEVGSHDFGDLRFFKDPMTGLSVPLFHVRRAVVVNRSAHNDSSSSNLYYHPELHSRITEAFKLGDHPSYGYLGITHTHPALSQVSPSRADLRVHDSSTPYGYSHIIRPGINMKEFTRQVIARYGSPEEALRQWEPYERLDERGRRLPAFDGPVKHNMRLNYLLRNDEGLDGTGMPVRADSRVFLFRNPQRPLTEEPNNFADPRDFCPSHQGHVIYVGEPGSRKITDWSIIPHSKFMDSHNESIRLGRYT